MWTHLLFLMFVALAVYAQYLTGYALACAGADPARIDRRDRPGAPDRRGECGDHDGAGFHRTFLYRRWPLQLERLVWPAVASSIAGTIAGTILLTGLAGAAWDVLRLLLGLSIVVCALLLWHAAQPWNTISSQGAFLLAGGLSGLLDGMFSGPGPPLVYLMYRQPLDHARVQETLIFFFGVGALLRLAMVVYAGQFSLYAVQLAAEAIPVVFLVTSVAAGRPAPFPARPLRTIVCLPLTATGAELSGAVVSAMSQASAH